MNQLEILRESLGQCDEIILDALIMRNRIVEDIMAYKEANGLQILQPEQEAKQKEWLEKRMEGRRHKDEVSDVFECIRTNSKRIQARKLFNYNIVLIGFMGAGKSTISDFLKNVFAMDVVEMDQIIAQRQGMSISDIFKEIQQAYKSIVSGEADRASYGGAGGYGTGSSQGYGGGYGSGGSYGPYGGSSYGGSSGGYGQYDDPFGGFGGFGPFGFGGYQRQNDYDPNDKDSRYFQAAKNYMNSGSYEEAKNVLNQIENHDAKWHYYSGVCNAGLGNQIRAMEMLKRAMELEPGNQEYRQAYESIKSGRQWYMDRGAGYGMDMPTGGKFCNNLCTICALMSCCMGGMPCVCCMPSGYGRS